MNSTWSRRLVASVLAGIAVAAFAFAVNLVGYLLVNQLQLAGITTAVKAFWQGGLFAFVFVGVAGVLALLRSWWKALLAGIVSAVVSGLLSALAVAGADATFRYLGAVTGVYLIFMVAVAAATPLLGGWVFTRVLDWRPSKARVAFVRVPSGILAQGLGARDGVEINTEVADQQWDAYLGALTNVGWQTIEVAPADRLPDGVFVEDAVVVFSDELGLVTRPGAADRRIETTTVADALRAQGYLLYEIEEPGTLDGGDVLIVGDTIYVGSSARSDADGIRQLREVVRDVKLPYRVVTVPVHQGLHLKSAASALPDGTILVNPDAVDAGLFTQARIAPELQGANVVVLDESTVLLPASAPETAELVRRLGYTVVTVDLSEFEKLGGTATGLSVLSR